MVTLSMILERQVDVGAKPASHIAQVGDDAGLIVAGPVPAAGPESLSGFLARTGDPLDPNPVEMLDMLRRSGLQGRGGAGFPLWRKIQAALDAPGDAMLVVNCSESEPASRKDRMLCTLRPHLILDGAARLARLVGTGEVFVHLHAGATDMESSLRWAMRQRCEHVIDDPTWRLSYGSGGYVSGESSAVARSLHSGVALPEFSSVPLARCGPSGRPTVVSNAETAAHVAIISRVGAERWGSAGSERCPGPQLLTVAGAVLHPGSVVELAGRTTIGNILRDAGVTAPPAGVLVGGYAGTWIRGDVAWDVAMEPQALARVGASRGCGLIGVLPHGACGLMETARLAWYLAGQTAGQCGPCVHGLPALAECVMLLAKGAAGRPTMRRLRRISDALPGSGACAHPDGVARLVRSALEAFDDDVIRHRAGSACRFSCREPVFPTPQVPA